MPEGEPYTGHRIGPAGSPIQIFFNVTAVTLAPLVTAFFNELSPGLGDSFTHWMKSRKPCFGSEDLTGFCLLKRDG